MSFFDILNTLSPSVNFDIDALDYFNRVNLANGYLTYNEKININTLVTSLKSNNIWNNYEEVGLFMGGFNSAFVKLKYIPTGTSVSNNINFTSNDYSASKGLTGNGIDKSISTGYYFSGTTVNNRNLSVGFYSTTNLVGDAKGVPLGTSSNTGNTSLFLVSSTVSEGRATTSTIKVTNIGQSGCIGLVSLCAGTTAQGGVRTYQGGSLRDTKGMAGVGSPSGQITLFSQVNSFFYEGSISAYYVGSFLSGSQITTSANIWNNFHVSIGRNSTKRNVFFGDSITYGYNPDVAGITYNQLRWSTQINNYINDGIECNLGFIGTVLQNSSPTITGNGRDRFNGDVLGQNPNYVYILYGVNDLRYNGVSFSATTFQTQLEEIIQLALDSGIPNNKIFVGSPPYQNPLYYSAGTPYNAGSVIKQQDYTDRCFAAATNKHVMYADVYQYMKNNGGDSLLGSDGIHPNTSGYTAIKTAFTLATQL